MANNMLSPEENIYKVHIFVFVSHVSAARLPGEPYIDPNVSKYSVLSDKCICSDVWKCGWSRFKIYGPVQIHPRNITP